MPARGTKTEIGPAALKQMLVSGVLLLRGIRNFLFWSSVIAAAANFDVSGPPMEFRRLLQREFHPELWGDKCHPARRSHFAGYSHVLTGILLHVHIHLRLGQYLAVLESSLKTLCRLWQSQPSNAYLAAERELSGLPQDRRGYEFGELGLCRRRLRSTSLRAQCANADKSLGTIVGP